MALNQRHDDRYIEFLKLRDADTMVHVVGYITAFVVIILSCISLVFFSTFVTFPRNEYLQTSSRDKKTASQK